MRDKFLVTKELGALARWLKILGYDTEYFQEEIDKLFLTAFNQARIIVTKDRKLPDSKAVKIIRIQSNSLEEQLKEFKTKGNFFIEENYIFTRCVECNLPVDRISKISVKAKVPPYVFRTQKNFLQCSKCKKIFWKATHYQRLKEFLRGILS